MNDSTRVGNAFLALSSGEISQRVRFPALTILSFCAFNAQSYSLHLFLDQSVHTDHDFLDVQRRKGCQIDLHDFDLLKVSEGTPLHSFLLSRWDYIANGPHFFSHRTDFFRTIALWKFGGWYIDHDVIFTSRLGRLQNVVHRQGFGLLNNAISHFVQHHPFLESLMAFLRASYSARDWNSAGPRALTRASKCWPAIDCSRAECLNIAGREVFNPIPVTKHSFMFTEPVSKDFFSNLTASSVSIHCWNRVSKNYQIVSNSIVHRAIRAFSDFPDMERIQKD